MKPSRILVVQDTCTCVSRKPWQLEFTADPEELAGIRRLMRLRLNIWGLRAVVDDAQLCLSELVTNVVTHVGRGTPVTLAVTAAGAHLRIEVHDHDTRSLPRLVQAMEESASGASMSESGRGMTLIDALATRWGVSLCLDRKITWCELPLPPGTGPEATGGRVNGPEVARAESLLGHYVEDRTPEEPARGKAGDTLAEETAIEVITDLLHWFRAQGRDADEVLDRAQTHFDMEVGVRVAG
jgi:anti-sigma regulatory factor (Ser/Thr protein kinase)